ncbi:hypothetical protein CBE01nite_10030 [Clostridium beijerinckii]|uniref:Uncharacterized protein n=1 Tax=Clostridium beijerinckii TaxID=1520 RepID=A0AB74VHA6_CLOBE|nr:hypothetical protein [Clostridium beijerinckii]NYB99742.1 hypothetical protein [Clostridium beijerinckii]OOM27871.1 hypothetical protein CLBEI_01930 [Clostridium beijerinckii]QUN35833.1 hypothetical protein KEC93_03110 [Clostridium beijerinckii]SQB13489.1 membrane protein [Clostridium beijerinckii]GEP63235.1 hypothetical protein CBE01nite_10030 [Clostridium beijerinckii]
MNFAYYLFLLLIIFLSISLIRKNLEVSPKKIKIYLALVITLFLLRHIALFLLCILKNSTIIYYLKPIIFLNHLSVPLIVLAVSYVYLRSEKLNFGGTYVIAATVCIIYAVIMQTSKLTVRVNYLYGFILQIDKETILFLFSLILLGALLILNVILLDRPYANKKGIWFIIIAILIVMIEDIIILGGIKLFPYSVIGDMLFLIIINLVLKGFKILPKNNYRS